MGGWRSLRGPLPTPVLLQTPRGPRDSESAKRTIHLSLEAHSRTLLCCGTEAALSRHLRSRTLLGGRAGTAESSLSTAISAVRGD